MLRSVRMPLLVLVLIAGAAGTAFADGPVDGHWKGKIKVPGQTLEIEIDFATAGDGSLSGDISIPVQGIQDLGLIEIALDGSKILFKIQDIPGDPSFDGTISDDGDTISGTFTQAGQSIPFDLVRGDSPAAAARAALDGFDAVVKKAIEDFNVPGLALAVVAGGEIVYAKGFGYRDLEKKLPMTADTLFAIGSTTKAMTATVLGTFVDDGALDWDAPVRTYLPSFRLSDPTITDRITLRDMLTHRSGLPRHDLLWYNNNESTREEVISRMAHLELTEDLRAKFQYNNLMFMTAGYLAGKLNGTNWEGAVRQRLLQPLGMQRSNFSVLESQKDPDHALPYRENDDDELELIPFRNINLIGPAGSVNSSVNEMTHWLLLNLRGGKAGDQRVVNASTLAEIHSPQMTTGSTQSRPDISPATYGMGWMITSYRGHTRISHGGGIDGFVTSVMFFPNEDLGLVSFDNRASGIASLVNQHASDRIFGLDHEDWLGEALEQRTKGKEVADEAKEKKETLRVASTRPSHDLSDYAGQYENPGYGMLRIDVAGDGLQLLYNNIAAPLAHWHYDVWNGAETDGDPTFQDQKFLFRGNVDGLIAEVEATLDAQAGPIVFSKRPDEKLADPEYLSRFVGSYETATGDKISVELSGSVLHLVVPGQPTYTLEPNLSGRFVLKEFRMISVGFDLDAQGEVVKAVLYQPNGVFDATPVKEE